MKKILMIIAPKGFKECEYGMSKTHFLHNNFEVITASKGVEYAKGTIDMSQKIDLDISEVKVENYDAIVLIGGPGATIYQNDSIVHKIVQDTIAQNKVLAAICIAPTILAKAGVLKGKQATVWNEDGNQSKILIEGGAIFTNEKITVDGKIITGNGPEVAQEFGKVVVAVLLE